MKRVQITMDLLRNIVSGLSQVGSFKTTEELIDFLTKNSEDCYFMDVEDHQVTDFCGDFDGDTLNTVEYKAIEPFKDTIELTERAIEQLSANAQISYILHNPDAKDDENKMVIMLDGEPVAVTDGTSITENKNKGLTFIGMDVSDPKNDMTGIVNGDRMSINPFYFGNGHAPVKQGMSAIGGAKVDAIVFDEAEGAFARLTNVNLKSIVYDNKDVVTTGRCTGCGHITDQCNSQTVDLQSGYLMYKCDDCEKKCDEREEDE